MNILKKIFKYGAVLILAVSLVPQATYARDIFAVITDPFCIIGIDCGGGTPKNLTVSCSVNTSTTALGTTVVWTAQASGSNKAYTYTWSGSENLSGADRSISKSYSTAGYKDGRVVVRAGNQTGTASCSNSVYVTPAPTPNPTPTYDSLTVTCSPDSTNITTNQSVVWRAYATGGNGGYNYSWSGSDGLYGNGSSVGKSYSGSGYKTANINVTSANGESRSASCSQSVLVQHVNDTPYYPPVYYPPQPPVYYPPVYQQPVYQQPIYQAPVTTYSPLDVSCGPNTRSAKIGDTIAWTANVVGGNGQYTYAWSGTDGVTGATNILRVFYDTVGTKYATITVQSNGQVITKACTSNVDISYTPARPPRSTVQPTTVYAPLDVMCTANPERVANGQPVSWVARVTGGSGVYKYSWSGSENLSGTNAVVMKSYQANGQKFALVNVTSAGKSFSKACDTIVDVGNGSSLGAFSLGAFSGGITWGFFGFIIFLILLAIIGYVMYNKERI